MLWGLDFLFFSSVRPYSVLSNQLNLFRRIPDESQAVLCRRSIYSFISDYLGNLTAGRWSRRCETKCNFSPLWQVGLGNLMPVLTLYQPMTHICVMSSHKPIRIYMGGLILGVNTLYRLFSFFKLFPMSGKG